MPPDRVTLLRSFIAQRPEDPFPRYALALEHKNSGRMEDAWTEFQALLAGHPSYVPAYLHAGNTLAVLGRGDAARDLYRRGIETATRSGDAHARGELEGALATLP